jgi:hypothetical protein
MPRRSPRSSSMHQVECQVRPVLLVLKAHRGHRETLEPPVLLAQTVQTVPMGLTGRVPLIPWCGCRIRSQPPGVPILP